MRIKVTVLDRQAGVDGFSRLQEEVIDLDEVAVRVEIPYDLPEGCTLVIRSVEEDE